MYLKGLPSPKTPVAINPLKQLNIDMALSEMT